MPTDLSPTTDLTGAAPPARTLTVADVEALAEELGAYHAHFAPLLKRSEQRRWAEVYLRGLLAAEVPRKNAEAIALRLLGAGPGAERRVRALQQFIGEGGWDDDALLAAHQRLVDDTLGEDDGVLIIDGSDLPKRGTHSAGVARQWCGASGKTENCQAGVFLGYASRRGYTLLDRRLYLPRAWFGPAYRERWQACRIPADTAFATKAELAAQMVEQVVCGGRLRARWLVCDEWYGRDGAFLDRVAAPGLTYLAEVPKDTAAWPLVDPADGQTARLRPQTWVPPRATSGKGRRRTRMRLRPESPHPQRMDDLAAQLPADQWHRYRILEGSKGPLVADFAALRAVAVRDGLPGPAVWVLLRRSLPAAGETPTFKYYLSNAPEATPLTTLVRVTGMRWPIESCFEEGKGEVGLDQYEVRFWRGWYHHLTLVILAHHFLVRVQRRLDQRGGEPATAGRIGGGPGSVPGSPARSNSPPGAPTGPTRFPLARADPAPAPGSVALAHP
jgi:SRSO17 transposase